MHHMVYLDNPSLVLFNCVVWHLNEVLSESILAIPVPRLTPCIDWILIFLTKIRSILIHTDLSFFGHSWKTDGWIYISTGGWVWEFRIEADGPLFMRKAILSCLVQALVTMGLRNHCHTYWWCLASFRLSVTLLHGVSGASDFLVWLFFACKLHATLLLNSCLLLMQKTFSLSQMDLK